MNKFLRFLCFAALMGGVWAHAMDVGQHLQAELLVAVTQGHLGGVRQLLQQGAPVGAKDPWGNTLLHKAAQVSTLEMCELLLEHGAGIDAKNDAGLTPLGRAVASGHVDVCWLLIAHGASLDVGKELSLLHLAARNGHVDVCRLLVAQGALVDAKDYAGSTPLERAIEKGSTDVCAFLIENGAAVNDRNRHYDTPLCKAVAYGRIGICELLIENGASVDREGSHRQTPLMLAARLGTIEICQLLAKNGASFDAKEECLSTPLTLAVEGGHEDLCKWLIDAKIERVLGKAKLRVLLGLRNRGEISLIDKNVIKLIAKEAYDLSCQQQPQLQEGLFAQISANTNRSFFHKVVNNDDLRWSLRDYVVQQLRRVKRETKFEQINEDEQSIIEERSRQKLESQLTSPAQHRQCNLQ